MFEVLLIDDESHITASIKKTLPWHEIEVKKVHEAYSAEEAIQVMACTEIDIVVTDIKMPGINGLDLVEIINERWPHIRCIVLTGYADFQYAQRAIRLHAFDYLLKPIKDEDLVASITKMTSVLKEEWDQSEHVHQISYNLKSNYDVLISSLFHDLLLGRVMTEQNLLQKLRQYDVNLKMEDDMIMVIYRDNEQQPSSLIEYAISNIANEILSEHFYVLHTTSPHHCSILLIQNKHDELGPQLVTLKHKQLHEQFLRIQKEVNNFLNRKVSFIVSDWFSFPQDIGHEYRSMMRHYYLLGTNKENEIIYKNSKHELKVTRISSLASLYKPPTLVNLLESQQWEAARKKLEDVFDDLKNSYSVETLYEVYFSVTNSFLYVAHKQNQNVTELDQFNYDLLFDRSLLNTLDKLKSWTMSILDLLERSLSDHDQYKKSYIISKVQAYFSSRMGEDISLKNIADYVNLHPVYLSKIYKAETGEGLSDYMIRLKMEKAMYMLKHENKKVYEITEELGYLNPQSFRKMFKKYYNMSPNEFRDT